jgi:hypothetical protein
MYHSFWSLYLVLVFEILVVSEQIAVADVPAPNRITQVRHPQAVENT